MGGEIIVIMLSRMLLLRAEGYVDRPNSSDLGLLICLCENNVSRRKTELQCGMTVLGCFPCASLENTVTTW